MNRLYLLRHGIAVPHGTPGFEEDERPLTEHGENQVRMVARGLKRMKLKLDRIVTSPLPRALKTAQLTAEILGIPDKLEQCDALSADRSAASIAEWLRSRFEKRLMIVGHNPAFSELVGLLASAPEGTLQCELRKGGVAAFETLTDGRLALDWLARPRIFRRLAQ